MIALSLLLIISGLIFIYAHPYQQVKIYEYHGWLMYMHAAKFGMYFLLASFFLFQVIFPFFYLCFLTLLKIISLIPIVPDISGNIPPILPIKNSFFFAYETPITILAEIIKELVGNDNSSLNHYLTSLSIFTFILSFLYSKYLSLRFQKDDFCSALLAQYRAHSPIDGFLIDAFFNDQYVLITLDTNKVYVGMPASIPLDSSEKDLNKSDIGILIFESGYRDSKNMDYIQTNNYEDIYKDYLEETLPRPKVVIKRESIVSISNFQPEHYYKAFKEKNS